MNARYYHSKNRDRTENVLTLYFMFLNRPPTRRRQVRDTGCARENIAGCTQGSQMDNMGRFVFLKEFACLLRVSVQRINALGTASTIRFVASHLRSASEELAKIQVSPDRLPYLEPSGSLLMTYSMPLPTSPVPPVTRITLDMTGDLAVIA